MYSSILSSVLLLAALGSGTGLGKKPNIILILTDDQDRRLGSLDHMPVLQRELVAKGTEFINHFATVSLCCPSRASLMRGQQAHNTNITHVAGPAGNYEKWVLSGEDKDYVPHWLKQAGYTNEYVGKFLNGYNTLTYTNPPRGWDHVDALACGTPWLSLTYSDTSQMDPYTQEFNYVIMSENGSKPLHYEGFHQSDVIRAKALARLDTLSQKGDPFFLALAPTTPHENYAFNAPVPCERHLKDFPDLKYPDYPNFDPPDTFQQQKSTWIKALRPLKPNETEYAQSLYLARTQALLGIDEMIEDVMEKLEDLDILDNTYVIFTSDNGWHIGQHRMLAGKSTPYVEDTNVPLIVRGPGVGKGKVSSIASTHMDLVPTFLDIAGVKSSDLPPFLDGSSMLDQWENPHKRMHKHGEGIGKEIINVEFWGPHNMEAPWDEGLFTENSYKTLRLVGEDYSFLYIKWCTGEAELYDTNADPYELTNLALNPNPETARLIDRLNALLLVTKSCSGETCRNPWSVLQPEHFGENEQCSRVIRSLKDAMSIKYDNYFAEFPQVHFNTCQLLLEVENERPFYPPQAESLGREWRQPTDNYISAAPKKLIKVPRDELFGTREQRYATLEDIMASAREVTQAEIGDGLESRSMPRYLPFEDPAGLDLELYPI